MWCASSSSRSLPTIAALAWPTWDLLRQRDPITMKIRVCSIEMTVVLHRGHTVTVGESILFLAVLQWMPSPNSGAPLWSRGRASSFKSHTSKPILSSPVVELETHLHRGAIRYASSLCRCGRYSRIYAYQFDIFSNTRPGLAPTLHQSVRNPRR